MLRYKKFIPNSFALLLLIVLASYFGYTQHQRYQTRKGLEKQIDSLKQQEHEIELKNSQLESSLQYLNSPDSYERLAKEQLNMARQGEIPVVFLPQKQPEKTGTSDKQAKPNWRLWLEYFFRPEI